jgi:transcriptional regulator with XRE-family HTH domain
MNKIKLVLKAQGRSQKWLSEQLGLSTASLSLYVNNHLSPKLETLTEIAKHLDVDVHDLIEHTKTSKSNPKNSLVEC